MSATEIRRGQFWVSKRYGTRHEVWDIGVDSRIDMIGPVGNAYTTTPSELRGEYVLEVGFPNGEPEEGPPQRIAGGTFPATDETAEAVRTRGERHIEMEGDR